MYVGALEAYCINMDVFLITTAIVVADFALMALVAWAFARWSEPVPAIRPVNIYRHHAPFEDDDLDFYGWYDDHDDDTPRFVFHS